MDLDPGEANPMWTRRSALASTSYASHRGGAPRDDAPACRIALPLAEVSALLANGRAGERAADRVTQVITWDAPLTLLADDHDLMERIQAMGVHVPVRGGTYAERQWDAREALEEVAHRYYDHGEGEWGVHGMITRQPHFLVAIVEGASPNRSLLTALMRTGVGSGLVVDARDPLDLRVFGVESLDHGRVLLVRADRVEEHRRDAVLEVVAQILLGPVE